MVYKGEMSETKQQTKVKKLPEGGWAIYGIDPKEKKEVQIGYIGENLNVEAFIPEGAQLIK